jgi:phytoene synthase
LGQLGEHSRVTNNKSESYKYCSDLVRRLDEDRWLASQYATPSLRERLIALYALHVECADIPSKVSEPALGVMRLKWWREALEDVASGKATRAHPVLEAARAANAITTASLGSLTAAIDARARLLYDEPFAQIEDLTEWLQASEAFMAPLAAGFANVEGESMDGLRRAAIAFALARNGCALAPNLIEDARAKARDLWAQSVDVLGRLSPSSAPAVLHLALTPAYVKRGAAISALERRWRLFSAMATGHI